MVRNPERWIFVRTITAVDFSTCVRTFGTIINIHESGWNLAPIRKSNRSVVGSLILYGTLCQTDFFRRAFELSRVSANISKYCKCLRWTIDIFSVRHVYMVVLDGVDFIEKDDHGYLPNT